MPSTTIKVPVELRDRLADLARAENTTLAGAIERSLAAAEDARFWADVAATLGADSRRAATDSERHAATLTDGLDPDEDWSDIW
jgi:predicted transcriptional regulator